MRFKTSNGNNYLLNRSIPQVLLLHPVLNFLLELKEKGISLEEWLGELKDEKIQLESGIHTNKEEIVYYHNYLLYLEENRYFENYKKFQKKGRRYTAESIKFHLANTQQIIFETTSSCNLKCMYCGYGDLYSGYEGRKCTSLDFETARRFLDYVTALLESPLNRKIHRRIFISFYGGEPLLNISFIKKMVDYAREIKLLHKEFCFSMTTNAVELDKHMDFLVKNDFILLLSLDGGEKNNGYRVFKDGSSSFKKVYQNIVAVKEKYPDYFERSVNFMSVLHDKNSNKEVNTFFQEHFEKSPLMSEVNSIGINPLQQDKFNEIFKKRYAGIEAGEIDDDLKNNKRILKTPHARETAPFVRTYSGFLIKSYERLLYSNENSIHAYTGTCNPFEKKVFITSDGNILPCERILQTYALGSVDRDGVYLDFGEIARKYNTHYEKVSRRCNRCSNCDSCEMCIFYLNLSDGTPKCIRFMDETKFRNYLDRSMTLLEGTPRLYPRIMRDYQLN